MLYNPDLKFKSRKYLQFNCALKLIKLRDSLSKTMGAPDIYLRTKVQEDIYETLVKFGEMRKLERANLVMQFDLFPEVVNLLTMERKYGDAINFEDINGTRRKKKKKARIDGSGNLLENAMTNNESQSQGQSLESLAKETEVSKSQAGGSLKKVVIRDEQVSSEEEEQVKVKRNPDTDARNEKFDLKLKQRSQSIQPNLQLRNIEFVHSLNTGREL